MLRAPARERRRSLDRSKVVEGLGHRSEAVGGAGGGGDDVVVCGQGLVVNVIDDGGEVIACGSGNDDLLGAGLDVGGSLVLSGEETGALENYVDAELAPGELFRVRLRVNGDFLAINGNRVLACDDLMLASIVALRGVILQKMREHLGGSKVVNGDNLGALMAEHLTESKATDAAKTVDSYLYCHTISFREAVGAHPRYSHNLPTCLIISACK